MCITASCAANMSGLVPLLMRKHCFLASVANLQLHCGTISLSDQQNHSLYLHRELECFRYDCIIVFAFTALNDTPGAQVLMTGSIHEHSITYTNILLEPWWSNLSGSSFFFRVLLKTVQTDVVTERFLSTPGQLSVEQVGPQLRGKRLGSGVSSCGPLQKGEVWARVTTYSMWMFSAEVLKRGHFFPFKNHHMTCLTSE